MNDPVQKAWKEVSEGVHDLLKNWDYKCTDCIYYTKASHVIGLQRVVKYPSCGTCLYFGASLQDLIACLHFYRKEH